MGMYRSRRASQRRTRGQAAVRTAARGAQWGRTQSSGKGVIAPDPGLAEPEDLNRDDF